MRILRFADLDTLSRAAADQLAMVVSTVPRKLVAAPVAEPRRARGGRRSATGGSATTLGSPRRGTTDNDAIGDGSAARVVTNLRGTVLSNGGPCHIALSGGSTPKRLFQILVERGPRFIPWQRVHLWWCDERCVAPDHPDSNYGMTYKHLVEPLGLDPTHVHRMLGESDPDTAASDYERALTQTLGDPPAFDLLLLGMGSDGHTASLFPESPATRETARYVVANRVDSPLTHGPTTRLTLTYPAINAAKRVRFLVSGSDKAEALAAVVEGPQGKYPAQHVAGADVAWFVDDAAAAKLGGNR